MRYKLTIEYDGTGLAGWQRQENGPETVQSLLEEAVFRFCGTRATVWGSGRTDAGVHAAGQVAHLDLEKNFSAFRVQSALNYHLSRTRIAVTAAEIVDESFHARFSATKRHYLYRILNRRPRLALEEGRAWHVPVPLDSAAMHEAAQILVGHHDFSSFRASICQAKSPLKTLDRLDVERAGEEIRIYGSARSFLHHQMRNMVGSLSLIGSGKWTKQQLQDALTARDRKAAGPTAPPEGLYLVGVEY